MTTTQLETFGVGQATLSITEERCIKAEDSVRNFEAEKQAWTETKESAIRQQGLLESDLEKLQKEKEKLELQLQGLQTEWDETRAANSGLKAFLDLHRLYDVVFDRRPWRQSGNAERRHNML